MWPFKSDEQRKKEDEEYKKYEKLVEGELLFVTKSSFRSPIGYGLLGIKKEEIRELIREEIAKSKEQ
jgi:hypothetical protein